MATVFIIRSMVDNRSKNGLDRSEHIAKILIDPRDSDLVYVASQGPLWSSGGDRGLYKSSNGGRSWEKILAISENNRDYRHRHGSS